MCSETVKATTSLDDAISFIKRTTSFNVNPPAGPSATAASISVGAITSKSKCIVTFDLPEPVNHGLTSSGKLLWRIMCQSEFLHAFFEIWIFTLS